MAERADRRVERTRRSCMHALVSLIAEKGYERITVQEIIDRADVGRSTFYAHYADKEALLLEGFASFRSFLVGHQRKALAKSVGGLHIRGFGFVLPLLEHVRDVLPFCRAIMKSVGHEHLEKTLTELVRDELKALAPRDRGPMPRDVVVRYAVSALTAVLRWWVDGGAKVPPAEAERIFRELALPGIASAVGLRAR
jgi:AcrR family transcriptional regulator